MDSKETVACMTSEVPAKFNMISFSFSSPKYQIERLYFRTLMFVSRIRFVQSLSLVQLFATPGTEAHQTLLSMGFPKQESWSELPFPSPGESSRSRDGTQVSSIGRWIL